MSAMLAANTLLLDANLLLLFMVGAFDRSLVGRKRLDVFGVDDFDVLVVEMNRSTRKLTTPHLLTEVSNLASQCVPKSRHWNFRRSFAERISLMDENWMTAAELCSESSFYALGLADAAVVRLADEQTRVLSVDLALLSQLASKGVNAENFRTLPSL